MFDSVNELVMILILIILVLFMMPFSYIQAFLIITLIKKLGYFRFVLILIAYIVFFGWTAYLLGEGYISLFLFFMVPILIDLIGVYFLRKEFINSLKKDFKKNVQ